MIKKFEIIVPFIVLLLLVIVTASCRQHRTPKSITFTRITKLKSSRSEKKQNSNSSIQEFQSLSDSFLRICIPAPISDRPEQIIRRKAYILSYNKDTKLPNWVAWHLTAEHTEGVYKRLHTYFEDIEVPEPRATDTDYRGTGWTHGHMCPAGDNKWDSGAMRESNILTNICPQTMKLNTGLWNSIEQDCRAWARKYGDVFIVCGPVLLKKQHETIGKNRVVVPEAFFKVILCLQGKPKAVSHVVRNDNEKKKRDQFINTVDDVERITGIDFFPALPDDIENAVEAKVDINEW